MEDKKENNIFSIHDPEIRNFRDSGTLIIINNILISL